MASIHPDEEERVRASFSTLVKGLPSLDEGDVLLTAVSARVAATCMLTHGPSQCLQIAASRAPETSGTRTDKSTNVSVHSAWIQSLSLGLSHILAELGSGWLDGHAEAATAASAPNTGRSSRGVAPEHVQLEVVDLFPPLRRACARHVLLLLLQLQHWAAADACSLHHEWLQHGLVSHAAAMLRLAVFEAEHCVTHPWEFGLWGGLWDHLGDHLGGARKSRRPPLTAAQVAGASIGKQVAFAVSHWPLAAPTNGSVLPPLHPFWPASSLVATVGTSPDYHCSITLRLLMLLRPILCDAALSGPGAYLASAVDPTVHAGVWRTPQWEALHRDVNTPPLPLGQTLGPAHTLAAPMKRGSLADVVGGVKGGINGRDRYVRAPHRAAAKHLGKQSTCPSAVLEGGAEWATSPHRLPCFAAPMSVTALQSAQAMQALSGEAAEGGSDGPRGGGSSLTAAARAELAASVKPQDLAEAGREAAAQERSVRWRRNLGWAEPQAAAQLVDLHITLARAVRVWITAWHWSRETMVPLNSETAAAMRLAPGITAGGSVPEVPRLQDVVDLSQHHSCVQGSLALRCATRSAASLFLHLTAAAPGTAPPSAHPATADAAVTHDAARTAAAAAVLWLHACSDLQHSSNHETTSASGERAGTVFVPIWFPRLLGKITRGKWVNLAQQEAIWQQLGEALTRQAAVMTTVCTLALQAMDGLQGHLMRFGHESMVPTCLAPAAAVLGATLPTLPTVGAGERAGGEPMPAIQASGLMHSTQTHAAARVLQACLTHSWSTAWAATAANLPALLGAALAASPRAVAALSVLPATRNVHELEAPQMSLTYNICRPGHASSELLRCVVSSAIRSSGHSTAAAGVGSGRRDDTSWLRPAEEFPTTLHQRMVSQIPLVCSGLRLAEVLAREYGEGSGRHEGKLLQSAAPIVGWMQQLAHASQIPPSSAAHAHANLPHAIVWLALQGATCVCSSRAGVLALLAAALHLQILPLAAETLRHASAHPSFSAECEAAVQRDAPSQLRGLLRGAEPFAPRALALRLALSATSTLLRLHQAMPHARATMLHPTTSGSRGSFGTGPSDAPSGAGDVPWLLLCAEEAASAAAGVLRAHLPHSMHAAHVLLLSNRLAYVSAVDELLLTWRLAAQACDLLCCLHTAALGQWKAPTSPPAASITQDKLPWLVPLLTHIQGACSSCVLNGGAAVPVLRLLLAPLLQAHPSAIDTEAAEQAKTQTEIESELLQGPVSDDRPPAAGAQYAQGTAAPAARPARNPAEEAETLAAVAEHTCVHRVARGTLLTVVGMCDLLLVTATSPLLGCELVSLSCPEAPQVLSAVIAFAAEYMAQLVQSPSISEMQWGTSKWVLDAAAACARALSALTQAAAVPASPEGATAPAHGTDAEQTPAHSTASRQASVALLAELLLQGSMSSLLQIAEATSSLLQLAGGVQSIAEQPKTLNEERLLRSWSGGAVAQLQALAGAGGAFPWHEGDPPLTQVAGADGCTLLHSGDGSIFLDGSVGVDVEHLRLSKAEEASAGGGRPSAAVAAAAASAWRCLRATGRALERMVHGVQVASVAVSEGGQGGAGLAAWRHPLLAPSQVCADALQSLAGGVPAAEVLHSNIQTHSDLMRIAIAGAPTIDPPPMGGGPLEGGPAAAQLVKAAALHAADGAPLRALFTRLAASSLPWAGMHEGGASRAPLAEVEGRRGGVAQRLARRSSIHERGGMARHGSWKGAAEAPMGRSRDNEVSAQADESGGGAAPVDGSGGDPAQAASGMAPTVSLMRRASMRFTQAVTDTSLGLDSIAGISVGGLSLGGGSSTSEPPPSTSEADVNLARVGRLLWRDLASTLRQRQVAAARSYQTQQAAEHSQQVADAYMGGAGGGADDGIALPSAPPPLKLNVEAFLGRVQRQVHLRHVQHTTDTRLDAVLELMVHLSGGLDEGGLQE